MSDNDTSGAACIPRRPPDYSHVQVIDLQPDPMPDDYRAAMKLAAETAEQTIGEHMLISWYDRDRDFESPQHSSECHQDSAVPGYVDYGLNHGARLKVDIGAGRFVFFFMPLDME
ncbi:MAG: AF1514 family protein [Thiobacillus sp.]|nr:AF1514 family protein [Thiobacillus sp.]